MESSTIAIIITIISMVMFVSNKFPMSVTGCITAIACGMLIPEMSLSQVYSSFGGSTVIMVAGMCIVGDALFETGIAQKLGAKICNTPFAKSERIFVVTVVTICTVMSAFLSNSATIAMWMPIIASVAAGSNGRIRSKMVIFPAGTACVIGGACTLVGSVSQGAANSVLMGFEGYEAGMGIFDMSVAMVPAAIIQIIWWGTIGYNMLNWVLKPGSPDFDKNNAFAVSTTPDTNAFDDVPAWKGTLSIVTLLACIVMFMLSGTAAFKPYLNIAITGMIGATFLFITGVMPVKKSFANLPWDILVCIGSISALATALDVSGGGKIIADAVLGLFGGENASIPVITAVICLLCSFLTLFMQNTGVAAMLTPVVIPMALAMGISPLPWVIIVAIGTNLAIATPIGTAVNMQILPAGYTFKDFVLLGGPLWIVETVVVVICSLMFLL
ncbi:MAG: anion permease [Peptococcaceae bacterium]|nr:anion permease [Peptococcaceae bacterium]